MAVQIPTKSAAKQAAADYLSKYIDGIEPKDLLPEPTHRMTQAEQTRLDEALGDIQRRIEKWGGIADE